ncbi:MAG: MFS transporter [Chloroflexales bacterium]|nr:MFS transporter [Chloroflexales bacterium]
MRLNYLQTFLLGFAFLGIQALFAVYNAYVPIFLQSGRLDFVEINPVAGGFGLNATLTGFIMTLDNLAAILILPYIGALSDVTVSRWGKRKPYIIAGAPLAVLAFAGIPFMLGLPLSLFMLVVVIFILAVDIFRTPVISLMPDITPSPLRSQANGIINLMGGLGATLAFVIGGVLYSMSPTGPFLFGSITTLIACAIVVFFVSVPREPDEVRTPGSLWQRVREAARNQEGGSIGQDIRTVISDRDRSVLLLLGAIFFWFLAYSALTVFFTSFATVSLGVARGQEALLLAFFSLTIVLFALPAGVIGARIGRKRSILLGLAIFTVALSAISALSNLNLIRFMLILSGIGWAMIVVNSLPMIFDSAPLGRIGAYTGLYYVASQSAEVIGPVLVGGVLDLLDSNYRTMFIYAPLMLIIAMTLMIKVQRGEVRTSVPAEAHLPEATSQTTLEG